jgi:hypothetical protein
MGCGRRSSGRRRGKKDGEGGEIGVREREDPVARGNIATMAWLRPHGIGEMAMKRLNGRFTRLPRRWKQRYLVSPG